MWREGDGEGRKGEGGREKGGSRCGGRMGRHGEVGREVGQGSGKDEGGRGRRRGKEGRGKGKGRPWEPRTRCSSRRDVHPLGYLALSPPLPFQTFSPCATLLLSLPNIPLLRPRPLSLSPSISIPTTRAAFDVTSSEISLIPHEPSLPIWKTPREFAPSRPSRSLPSSSFG